MPQQTHEQQFAATYDPAVKKKLEELARISAALEVLVAVAARRTCELRRLSLHWIFSKRVRLLSVRSKQFRRALEDSNEEGRWQLLNASLNGIKLSIAR